MTKENKNPNVPNLRFNYNGKWKKYELNEIIVFFKGNGFSKNDISSEGKPIILYGELYTTYKDEIIHTIISKTNNTSNSDFLSKFNDIIIPSSGEDPIDIAVARVLLKDNIILGGDLNVLRPKVNLSSAFLSYELNGKRKLDIAKKAQGKSIVHLHNSDLKTIKVFLPNFEEQTKIANLLQAIDKKINTQIKIISSLESQRKGIISFLLKQLKSFNELSLSEILIEFNKKTTTNNEFPVLSSTASGIHLQSDYFNKGASSDDTTGYKILPKNYGTYRSMSDTGRFNFNQQTILDYGIVSPAYPVFYSNTYNLSFVILYLNNSSEIKKQILELKTGGTRFALSFQKLCTLNIPNISLKQQNNVMQIINSIDLKIQNENNLLNLYNRQKDYLLNNLFV